MTCSEVYPLELWVSSRLSWSTSGSAMLQSSCFAFALDRVVRIVLGSLDCLRGFSEALRELLAVAAPSFLGLGLSKSLTALYPEALARVALP